MPNVEKKATADREYQTNQSDHILTSLVLETIQLWRLRNHSLTPLWRFLNILCLKVNISLVGDSTKPVAVKILRDTGASQSIVLAGVLPFSEKTYSGTSVLLQGVECGFMNVPLHNIFLSSELVTGPVTVGVRSSLPFDGIHLLLGNDLAGAKVVVNPLVSDKPSFDQSPDLVEQEFPDLFPACAVTRGMAKRAIENDFGCDIDLADTLFDQIYSGEINKSLNISPSEIQTDCTDNIQLLSYLSLATSLNDEGHDKVSRSQFIEEQRRDHQISCLFDRAISENEVSQDPVCYFTKNGILMRKWRPPAVSADAEWSVIHQIVIPLLYRKEILSMAHDTPMSGHLGVNKTYHRILTHFYWPSLKKDVSQYCRNCHTCQMVGKPNQKIPKAHLQPIPAFEEPFSRIIVDCVGPLPRTKSGNQYLLTIMCASTRFPEAIPLRNIKSKSVVKALVKFFTLFGLPKVVQSDQGTNFMSNVFRQVMLELGIQQLKSSAYHPESQGALERFHQTLKNMVRTYCFDPGKDWDEGIHLLLFAIRESVQESLGFSPFELVFGHNVRGPLKLLKEKILSEDTTPLNLLQYVSGFKHKLSKVCEIAKSNLKSSQTKMKMRYDLTAKERKFNPGEKVLVLLPIIGNTLQARYHGPYLVEKRISDLNYIIQTPDRRKQRQLCHINMLKPYFDKDSISSHSVNIVYSVPVENIACKFQTEDEHFVRSDPSLVKLQNSDIMRNLDQKLSHLETVQRLELSKLIWQYKQLFSDVPTITNKTYHDVDVGSSLPIKQHPYRMNTIKTEISDRRNSVLARKQLYSAK